LIAVLAEAKSDFRTLVNLLRAVKRDSKLPVKGKGYRNRGELLTKGAGDLGKLSALGCTRAIICTDADGADPRPAYSEVHRRVVNACLVKISSCIVIPVQELEAWIVADMAKVKRILKSFKPKAVANPEQVASPKELLRRLSQDMHGKSHYDHVAHNELIVPFLDWRIVYRKCPSFRPLYEFIAGKKLT
jgi:hypothetical protein